MVYLKFYAKEHEEFTEISRIYLPTQRSVQVIVNKLTRHFKMRPINVEFTKRKPNTGDIYTRTRLMRLHKSVFSLGTVTHEVAHQMLRDQTGKSGHTKKLMVRIRRLNRYCKKMDYWGHMPKYLDDYVESIKCWKCDHYEEGVEGWKWYCNAFETSLMFLRETFDECSNFKEKGGEC